MANSLVDIFRVISQELDARNDKTERIVKLSRDITIESKRTISLLQRSQFQSRSDRLATLKKADMNLAKLRKYNFFKLAQELEHESPFYFNRSFTFGLQEYIEAVSFLHYMKEGTLVSHSEVQKSLTFKDAVMEKKSDSSEKPQDGETGDVNEKFVSVHVSLHDYILGIMDLTGELMRSTINASPADSLEFITETNKFLQLIYQATLAFYGYRTKELSRKVSTLLSSVLKIESYVYSLKIREMDQFGGIPSTKPIFVDTFENQPNRHYNDDYDSGNE